MTAPNPAQLLRLADGRAVSYAEYGDPRGITGFYFHGHPGSRLEAQLADDAAAARGLRIVAIDRPGYGQSDFQEGRALLDWPRDVAEVADQLGLGTFSVLGASGGGPYALACGYTLPERVTKVGIVSGVGPYSAPHATDGMRWQNRLGFQWGARFPFLASFIMRSMARQVRRDPERVVEAIGKAMSGPDAEVVRRPEVRKMLAEVITEAFRQGHRGAARDVVLLGRAWGFEPSDVRVPVFLWQGESDQLVSPAMGHYLAEAIPNCRAAFYPNEGHLLVVGRMSEIVEAMAG